MLTLALLTGSVVLPAQNSAPDPIAHLLTDLETALGSGDPTRLTLLESPALAPDIVNGVARSVVSGPDAVVAVRERARRTTATGVEVLADVFLGSGTRATVVTWRIKVATTDAGKPLIVGVDEQGSLDGLLKLTLDASHQFAIHNLVVRAIDFTLTMASGSAFLAQADDGVTALVLRGKGEVRFAPPDRAEQGQLQVFAHQSELVTQVSDAFVRLNPSEFTTRVSQAGLEPVAVNPNALTEARTTFEEFSPLTYGVDLRELGQRGWSFEPHPGNVVVEFKSGLGWLTYARSPSELEDITLFKRSTMKLISSYASAERLATRGKSYDESANAPYRVEHYDLDVTFDPLRHRLNGHAVVRTRVMSDGVNSLMLRLNDDLAVSSVTAPGAERLLAVRMTGQNRVLVTLPSSVPRDSVVAIDVAYSGTLAPGPFDREALSVGETDQQDPAQDFRLEPERVWVYSSRPAWYPQSETPGHATATMRIHVPAQYDVAASGTMTRSSVSAPTTTSAGERTSEFVADRPIRYLACAISRLAPLASTSAPVDGLAPAPDDRRAAETSGPASVNVAVVTTPHAVNEARGLSVRASDILHYFATLVGEAPYPALTIAAVDENVIGGHSPAYLTVLRMRLPTSQYLWRADPVAFDRVPNFLLAHEVAHQWWGQAVGWKNYHEQWLSEGLAQYFAVRYAGSVLGPETMNGILSDMRDSVLDLSNAGPISLGYRLGHLSNDPTMFRVVLYNKSAVVLDMLRRLIGDKAFDAGLARFYRAHRFGAAGTDDLAKAFEAETPIVLDHFFDTWVRTSTIPEVRVTTSIDAGGRSATVKVDPVNAPADFPLTLTVQYEDGTSEDVTIPVIGSTSRQIPLKSRARRLVTKEDLTLVRIR